MKKVSISKNAFTIIETVVSLFIFSTTLIMITSFIYIQGKTKNNNFTDFFFYIQNIENKNYQFVIYEMKSEGPIFYSQFNDKKYILEQYKSMIRLRTFDGGHIPLMDNVESVKWSYYNNVLISQIETKYNQKTFKTYIEKDKKWNKEV